MCLKEAIEIADDGERDQFLSQGYTGEFSASRNHCKL